MDKFGNVLIWRATLCRGHSFRTDATERVPPSGKLGHYGKFFYSFCSVHRIPIIVLSSMLFDGRTALTERGYSRTIRLRRASARLAVERSSGAPIRFCETNPPERYFRRHRGYFGAAGGAPALPFGE